jgi:hypothetical protein
MPQPTPITVPNVRDLATPEGLRDPYAVYARFRAAEAAGHDIGRVVVRYDQVAALLADRRLSSDRAAGILAPPDAAAAECEAHLLQRLPGPEFAAEDVAWQPAIDFRGPRALSVRRRPEGSR